LKTLDFEALITVTVKNSIFLDVVWFQRSVFRV